MEETTVELTVQEPEPMVHQIAKLVLGTLAGFMATKAVAVIYDAVLERAREDDEIEPDLEV